MSVPTTFISLSTRVDLVAVELAVRAVAISKFQTSSQASLSLALSRAFDAGSKLTPGCPRSWEGNIFGHQAPYDDGLFYELQTTQTSQHPITEYLLSHTRSGPLILAICDQQRDMVTILHYASKNDRIYKKKHELQWITSKVVSHKCRTVDIGIFGKFIRKSALALLLLKNRITLTDCC